MLIDYDGFEDLAYKYHQAGTYLPDPIPIWYGFSADSDPTDVTEWIRAAALDDDDDPIVDSLDLHGGITYKLWNKIQVLPCHSACEYEDKAKITIVLQGIKRWIDPATGLFKS